MSEQLPGTCLPAGFKPQQCVFIVISTDALKVQLVEAGVQEALSEILMRLQGSSQAENTCIVKAASDLIVSLLLGGKKKKKKKSILTVQILKKINPNIKTSPGFAIFSAAFTVNRHICNLFHNS